MANIAGTAGRDFIRRAGDGNNPPAGYNEIATATAGDDAIRAGDGDDIVDASAGADTIRGGEGNDSLDGSAGADLVFGDGGNDTLIGYGADTLSGGFGDDTFSLRRPEATDDPGLQILGGAGTDTLRIESLSPIDITGVTLSGVERLEARRVILTADQLMSFEVVGDAPFTGRSILYLSAPATVDLTGTAIEGSISLIGTAGADTIVLPNSQIVTSGADGNDTIVGGEGNEYVGGGSGDDSLIGNGSSDVLFGDDGADILSGGAGDDYLDGGAGADSMSGGEGNDDFYVREPDKISGLAETIDGGNGHDKLELSSFSGGVVDFSAAHITGVEELELGYRGIMTPEQLGDFSIITGYSFGFGGPDHITLAGPGVADLTGATIIGLDAIRGSAGNDGVILTGVAEGQTVLGFAGNDTLTGGLGADALDGGNGRDRLQGSLGADTLTGGAGPDSFVFRLAAESTPAVFDKIADFASGLDRIDLRGVDADTGTAGNQAFAFIGSGAFSGAAGELRYAGGLLLGDVDGDATADLQVSLAGTPALAAGDVLL